MSIVNLWRDDGSAFVAVDSNGLRPEGLMAPFAKIFCLPLHRCLIAARGERVLMGAFLSGVYCSDQFIDSYDGLIAAAPALLGDIQRFIRPKDPHLSAAVLEIFIVGWSDAKGRMSACRMKDEPGQALEVEDLSDASAYVTPHGSEDVSSELYQVLFRQPSEQGAHADLLDVMRRQVDEGRAASPATGFGGRIFLGRIDAMGLGVDEIGVIE